MVAADTRSAHRTHAPGFAGRACVIRAGPEMSPLDLLKTHFWSCPNYAAASGRDGSGALHLWNLCNLRLPLDQRRANNSR